MSDARTRTRAALALVFWLAHGFSTAVRCAGADPPDFHVFLSGKERMVVNTAIAGAVRRLANPECQRLFTDFVDRAGHTLSANLEALGKTPAEHLAELYFVAGDTTNQCRLDETNAAFTTPHSRVIYMCSARFADRFARKTAGGEILIIHELLHTLGLGENPPTSAQITRAVMNRCGK